MPDDKCYDRACLEEVTVKYNDYIRGGARTAPLAIRAIPAIAPVRDPEPVKTSYVPRNAYLKPKDCLAHGYTPGCRGCEWLETGNGQRRNHNNECRERLEALPDNDTEGAQRLKEAKERTDTRIAKTRDHVEDE